MIYIPTGKMASDADLAAKRVELKHKLLSGDRITLSNNGNAMNGGSSISVPQGKLASDADLAAKRAELKHKLLSGDRITLSNNGNAMNGGNSISVPQGKLAAYQWYERDPELLEAEKAAMNRAFPNFTLDKLDDGRLYWIGTVCPGIYESKYGRRKEYALMAVYQNNHPEQVMGSSVRVYPIEPDVDELIQECGFRPYHLLTDSNGDKYLCTAQAEDVKTGRTSTSAASVLAWAVKWLMAYELVLTGDMPKEDFMVHGRI